MILKNRREAQIYISVILPSLNVAQYIRECIESVQNQTLNQIEILCVDAGSTDGTLEILEEYAEKDVRIRVIKSDKKSYGYQINLGIKEAKGQYIGIVETDDFIDAKMYQKLFSYVENGCPDFIKGGFYDYAEVENRKYICEVPFGGPEEVLGKLIYFREGREKGVWNLNHIWAGIYRREFLLEKEIKLNETPGASYQDTSFSLLVGLLADTGIYAEGSYYYYRRNNENSSVKSNSKWRCVIDELEYTAQELIRKEKYSVDIQQLVWKYKPVFYFWNFLRLPEKERKLFLDEIRSELEEYTRDGVLYHLLNDSQKKMVDVMKEKDICEYYFAKKEELEIKYKKLIELIKRGEKCVLVSAGSYGERMLLLQKLTGVRYIDSVADNNEARQGYMWNGYRLISISDAVHKYKKHLFVVANKKYSEEIREQLRKAGVHESRILIFDDTLSSSEMIDMVVEDFRTIND